MLRPPPVRTMALRPPYPMAGRRKGTIMIESVTHKWLPCRGTASRRVVPMALVVASVLAMTAPVASAQSSRGADNEPVGAVYVATNAYAGNQIITYLRASDGSLTPTGTAVPTGGRG